MVALPVGAGAAVEFVQTAASDATVSAVFEVWADGGDTDDAVEDEEPFASISQGVALSVETQPGPICSWLLSRVQISSFANCLSFAMSLAVD